MFFALFIVFFILLVPLSLSSRLYRKIWKKLRGEDRLILLLPVCISSISLIRYVNGFIWIWFLIQGYTDFFGIRGGCSMNFVFYFPSLIMVIITTMLNLAIWANFVGSVSLIRRRKSHMLRTLRLWIIIVVSFVALCLIFLPILLILINSC